jgi:hypothetical protein
MVDTLMMHLEGIFSLSWATLLVSGTLCAITCYLMKDYLAHPPVAILIFPMMLLFSMAIQYAVICAELYSPRAIEQWLMWTIFSATCGSVTGVAVVGGLAAVRYSSLLTTKAPPRATSKATGGRRSLSA